MKECIRSDQISFFFFFSSKDLDHKDTKPDKMHNLRFLCRQFVLIYIVRYSVSLNNNLMISDLFKNIPNIRKRSIFYLLSTVKFLHFPQIEKGVSKASKS